MKNKIENLAIEKGCRLIILDTFSVHASKFYKKLGFKVIGVIKDNPKGHNQYFMETRL